MDRAQIKTLLERLDESPRHMIVVTGPRQTGKTTMVRAALRSLVRPTLYRAVDQSPDRAWLVEVWREARRFAAASKSGAVLALDEIQRIPYWQDTVKGLWETDRFADTPLHVVLLGSAQPLMGPRLAESLLGRFETTPLAHWSLVEMAEAFGFDLPQYVYFGGYPGAAEFVRAEDRWRRYVAEAIMAPNIERDILALVRVDKPALLKRLFELCCEFGGQILPYRKVLGKLYDAVNATTPERYLELLGKVGLVAVLNRYERAMRWRRQSSAKLVPLNTALMAAHSRYTSDEARADRTFWNRMTAAAVGAHLCNTAGGRIRVCYWRRGDAQVDFVLESGPHLAAVAVQSNGRRTERGRKAFEKHVGAHPFIVVGSGGVPLSEFLAAPAGHWFQAAA